MPLPPGAVPWCLGIKSLCYSLLRTEGKRRSSQLTQCSIGNCICGTVRTQPPNGLNGSAISSGAVPRSVHAAVVATLNVWITEHKGRLDGLEGFGCLLYTSPSPRDG